MNHTPTPHPAVVVLRVLWQIAVGLFILGWTVVFVMLILDGALWIIPIVAVPGYFTFILLRNRRRRRSLRSGYNRESYGSGPESSS